ncbi:MAG: tRNA uracil 4-sulfurtransferase ThiI [Candidatus Gracilibacteria bacterium]|nr:tRNA uracil 4-sulfurtransferase ThiI [Candidatus Gracilibacteria bacterium]
MKYIVKISPELSIKSRGVRKRAVINLRNNIKTHLEFNNIKANLTGNWDRINIDSKDNNNISNILLKIPGISNFLEVETIGLYDNNVESVEKLSLNEVFELIYTNVKDYYLDKVHNKTFSVRVKRIGNHSFKSIDLERFLGFSLLRDSNNSKVKLELPDIIVKIEIKDYNLYIVKNKVEGIGGYPVGFQDRVLSLISGGFDSGVSTYSMIKRGCEVDYLFFNLGGNAHELGVKQVSNYLWRNFSIPYKRAKFITVNFEEIVKELIEKVNHKYRGIILKRYMLKLASIISEGSHYALIKGDSLGQVSSQTLKNIHVIDKASNNLVFRPLISYNKQEIVDISKQIGTYNFACNMPEYCGVISDRPSVGAKLEDILLEEEKILDEVLLRAVENKKIEFVKDMMEQYKGVNATVLDVVFLPGDNEVIIDIREKTSIDKKPLIIENVEKIEIPFYDINYKFESLDNTKIYLLYCDKGILSNLHGLYLIEKGFQNVKIYRSIINDKSCSI